MAADDRGTERSSNPSLIAGLVINICIVIGVIVWAGGWGFSNDQGGWGFSNDQVATPNPAQHAGNTSPPAQMPMRSTTGSR
jgi:hypothetical protein